MTQYRVILTSGGFNFASSPMRLQANINTGVNIVTSSYGRVLGSAGTRLWDTGVIPANYSTILTAGSTLDLPLITTNLPSFYFDAVILTQINGTRYAIGASNSPDNVGVYSSSQPVSEKNLYWMELRCYGLNGGVGNSAGSNHYLFGGTGESANNLSGFNVFFSDITTSTFTMTCNQQFFPYSGTPSSITTNSVVVPIGVYSVGFPTQNWFVSSSGGGSAGYIRFSLSIVDTSYHSLLPFYHWGFA